MLPRLKADAMHEAIQVGLASSGAMDRQALKRLLDSLEKTAWPDRQQANQVTGEEMASRLAAAGFQVERVKA